MFLLLLFLLLVSDIVQGAIYGCSVGQQFQLYQMSIFEQQLHCLQLFSLSSEVSSISNARLIIVSSAIRHGTAQVNTQ
jgi:hypothetical protein